MWFGHTTACGVWFVRNDGFSFSLFFTPLYLSFVIIMSQDGPVSIVVDDPQSTGFGPTKYTTYRLRTVGHGSATVRHRFSGFVNLRSELLLALPGVVVPPLPEKQIMSKFSAEFIEKRRKMLEIFLQRCLEHPIVSGCEKLHVFLTWQEGIRSAVIAQFVSFVLPPSPAGDMNYDALASAMGSLETFQQQLQGMRSRFKAVQRRESDNGTDLGTLATDLKNIADNPLNSVLSIALQPFSEGMQALATHTRSKSLGDKQTLIPKLKLHRMLALALMESFKGREKVSKEIDAINAKIKELLNSSTKLAGKPGKEKAVADLEHKVTEKRAEVEILRERFTLWTRTLHWELDRYQKAKNVEILAALQAHAVAQTESAGKQHELWGNLSAAVMNRVKQVTSEAACLAGAMDQLDPSLVGRPRAGSHSGGSQPGSQRQSFNNLSAAAPEAPPTPPPNPSAAAPTAGAGAAAAPAQAANPFAEPANPFAAPTPSVSYEPNFNPPPPPPVPGGDSLSSALWSAGGGGGNVGVGQSP